MNISLLSSLLLVCVSLLLSTSCEVKKSDAAEASPSAANDRNMFGHRIPRGLTINSEGLADGYVMFAVPNSASMYLINRKGEVVHEWKGNYPVMGGYL